MPTNASGPHLVHFSPVKEVVEIESGRFEFFKQMIAIGLAGLAGLAAIFTGDGKVPSDIFIKFLLSGFAVSAILVVIGAAMGIATYANHLRDVRLASEDPGNAENKTKLENSSKGLLSHAKLTLVASAFSAIFLILFAGARLFMPETEGVEDALMVAKKLIVSQEGAASKPTLEDLTTTADLYRITMGVEGQTRKFVIVVDKSSRQIKAVTRM